MKLFISNEIKHKNPIFMSKKINFLTFFLINST